MSPSAGPCPLIENIRATRLELLRISPSGVASYERAGEVVTADVADAVAELMNLGRCGLDALIRRELSSQDARAYLNAVVGGSRQAYAYAKHYYRPGEVAAAVVSLELSTDGWVVKTTTLPTEHDPFDSSISLDEGLSRIDAIAKHPAGRAMLRCLLLHERLRNKMAAGMEPDRIGQRDELLAYLAAC